MLLLFCALTLVSFACGGEVNQAYVDLNAVAPRFNIYKGGPSWSAVAWGSFENSVNETGFGYLEIYTNGSYPDSYQAYAAGILEGYLTRDLIGMHYRNTFARYCENQSAYCERLYKFLNDQLQFTNKMIKQHARTCHYWHQVQLVYNQLYGIQDGFDGASKEAYFPQNASYENVTPLLFLNVDGDLEDLEQVLKKDSVQRVRLGDGHCSALIKVLPNSEDLYTSQATWSGYNTMLRILKKYSFQYHYTLTSSQIIPGHTSTFSSAPGKILSGDDFYTISTGLVSQETTIGNGDPSRWKYVTPESNPEWVRNLVANRLAANGSEWCYIMSKENSGTYNNQWMIVDYNKFTKGQPLRENSGLLTIYEQIPGMQVCNDYTKTLVEQGYFASYNIPVDQGIYNASGWWDSVKKYGDWFTYDKSPRARIFRRDHVKVTDLDSMIKLMRYNDYKNDEFSRCNCTPPYSAENAISARSDLNPANGTYPFSALGHRSHGGTDMKVTTSDMIKQLLFKAVSGPTYDQQLPFRWSTSGFNDLHEGHPDVFMFQPHIHQWGTRDVKKFGRREPEEQGL